MMKIGEPFQDLIYHWSTPSVPMLLSDGWPKLHTYLTER